jgi:hypothetical protein
MGIREEPRLFFADRPSRTPTFVNSSNLFAHGRKFQVCPFDHPGSELHNLLCRKTLLRNESADNHFTDTERSSGLLRGDPQSLIWWWTGRKAVCVADMLHALLSPSVGVASYSRAGSGSKQRDISVFQFVPNDFLSSTLHNR